MADDCAEFWLTVLAESALVTARAGWAAGLAGNRATAGWGDLRGALGASGLLFGCDWAGAGASNTLTTVGACTAGLERGASEPKASGQSRKLPAIRCNETDNAKNNESLNISASSQAECI
jgi:hypothetical protein